MSVIKNRELPDCVSPFTGKGGLPALRIETDCSIAEIYLHGAQVTHFQIKDEAPLLFMSVASDFHSGKPIRGGVPIIFPWFGAREGLAAHGFARLAEWELVESIVLTDGSVKLSFRMPADDEFQVEFIVTVGQSLTMELIVNNIGSSDFTFEACLHTYFQIGEIEKIGVTGLLGARYRDQVLGTESIESESTLRFNKEIDRTYQDTDATVEILDPVMQRTIRVRKSDSKSTVVWNPWIAKSQRMPDFGDTEYLHMVCVESGNVREHAVTLAPGERSSLKVELDSTTID